MNFNVLNSLTVLGPDANSVPICTDVRQSLNLPQSAEAVVEENLLDWDAHIPFAPKRLSGSIQAKFEYGGRGKPTPIEDPWA